MKRILYSCLFLISLCFTSTFKAQVGSFSIQPQFQCYNPSNTYTAIAEVVLPPNGTTDFSWTISGTNCTPTFTTNIGGTPTNTHIGIAIPCCTDYTVQCVSYVNGVATSTLNYAFVAPGQPTNGAVYCPNGAVLTPSIQNICIGSSATLTSANAVTYTWVTKTGAVTTTVSGNNTATLVSTPTANTTYTVLGTTSQGCIITTTANVNVQNATVTATPASQTLCTGAPVCFTATANGVNTASYTTGTTVGAASYTWVTPGGTTLTPGAVKCTTASVGAYTVFITHNGAAGACTNSTTVQVNTIATIPITITPASPSVCPGATINLIASSQQTASTSYTWTAPTGPSPVVSKTLNVGPSVATDYTVDVTYYGCTGTKTITVGIRQLTVNLTSSSPSTCPGRSLTLTASGGISYTFTAFPANGLPTPSFTLTKPTANTAVDSPTLGQLAMTYVVNSFSLGCVGSKTITVGLLTISPTLTSSSPSVCPSRNFTLSTTGGAGTTYTYTTPLPLTIVTGTTRTLVQSITSTAIYTVNVDSAGCIGTSNVQIDILTLNTSLAVKSTSVCTNTPYTFTASGGAGTNYTFTPPAPPTMTVSGNTATHIATSATLFPLTYTVDADSLGCVGQAQITITERTLTPGFSISSASICAGSPFTFTAIGGAGTNYTFSASYAPTNFTTMTATSNTTTTSYTAPSSPTPYTYTLTADSAGCKGVSTVTTAILGISQNFTLSATSSSNVPFSITPSVCPGSTFTLGVHGNGSSTYTFTDPHGIVLPPIPGGPPDTAVVSVYTVSANIYTVTVDSAGCVGSRTLAINLLDLHRMSLVASPSVVCSGIGSTLTANGVGNNTITPTTFTFYNITNSPPNPPILLQPPSASNTVPVTPTIQSVYAVIADSAGCRSPLIPPGLATVTININAPLTLTMSATSTSVCPGLSTTLSVGGGTGSSTFSYTWTASPSPPPFPITGTDVVTVNPTVSTTYTASATDPGGCVGEASITVGIDPFAYLPIQVSISDATICPGLFTTLTASTNVNTLGGVNTISYTWTPANVSYTPGANNPSVTVSPPITTLFYVNASNPYGCFSSATNSVLVFVGTYPQPIAVPNTPTAICVGFTSTLTGTGANSYTWTGSTFTGSIAQPSISVGPGTSTNSPATYTLHGSNGGGCVHDTVIAIGLAPPLIINISSSSPTTCIANNSPKFSQPVNLTATGAQYYTWFPYDPLHMTYSLGPTTTVRPASTTQYTVTGSSSICSGTKTITIVVIPQFTMNVVPPLPAMCLGDSIKLSITNVSTLAVGPVSAWTYSWTEAQNAPPISISDILTPTVMVFPQNTTTYSVEVLDSRGCISLPRLVTVTVLPKPITAIAIPTINSVATNTVCYVGLNPGAQDVTINLTANNMNTGLQFGVSPSYTWISPYSVTSILTPANANAITVNAPTRLLHNSAISVYTLISGYNGVVGCRRVDTVSVRVVDCRPVRQVKFTTSDDNDTICARTCITFLNLTDTMAGGPQTYTWTFFGGSPKTSTLQIPTVCYNLPSKTGYDVILRVANPYPIVNANGPTGSSNTSGFLHYIKVVDVPDVTIFSPGQLHSDTTIRFGQSVNLNGSGASTYAWFPNYNISSLSGPNAVVRPFKTTQYILTGYNSKKCASSDTINVNIIEDCGEMYVPNAFTPNNDGVNDVLYVRGICLQSLTFMVFDRWGEKVFETADQAIGWDGSYKGEDMNTQVFVYRLEGKTYEGKAFSLKGNVTLIR